MVNDFTNIGTHDCHPIEPIYPMTELYKEFGIMNKENFAEGDGFAIEGDGLGVNNAY